MLSTLRLLTRNAILENVLPKTCSASYHVYTKQIDSRNWTPPLCGRKLPLATLPLTSVSFLSTDSSEPVLKSFNLLAKNDVGTIPEPPTPLIEETPLQVFQKEDDLIAFMEAILREGESRTLKAVASASQEPSFESIGLGGWSPVGMVQNCMEYLHIDCGVPWWGAIVLGTVVVRSVIFPLVIMAQRNAAKMHNCLPEMQAIQLKMTDARHRGDRLDAARYAQELMQFMNEKQLNPMKNMLVPLAQAPFFISFFMGLRSMANLPVESLREGGLFWFVDLTLSDQFYALPLITCATLWITIEVGTDAGRSLSSLGLMKYALRGMPVVLFPFMMGFPAAILVYWTSTNFISLLQVLLLKIPQVREYFKIEKLKKFDTKDLPMKDKGLVKGIKENWTNMKITREIEERERIDEINFMRAGRGSVKKTFKFDPTQVKPPRNDIGGIEITKRE